MVETDSSSVVLFPKHQVGHHLREEKTPKCPRAPDSSWPWRGGRGWGGGGRERRGGRLSEVAPLGPGRHRSWGNPRGGKGRPGGHQWDTLTADRTSSFTSVRGLPAPGSGGRKGAPSSAEVALEGAGVVGRREAGLGVVFSQTVQAPSHPGLQPPWEWFPLERRDRTAGPRLSQEVDTALCRLSAPRACRVTGPCLCLPAPQGRVGLASEVPGLRSSRTGQGPPGRVGSRPGGLLPRWPARGSSRSAGGWRSALRTGPGGPAAGRAAPAPASPGTRPGVMR